MTKNSMSSKFSKRNASLWVKMLLDCLENGNEAVAKIGIDKLRDVIPQGVRTISVGERTFTVRTDEESVANWDLNDIRARLKQLDEQH